MLIDKYLMERYRATFQGQMVNCDSFKVNAVALDEAKKNMIDVFQYSFKFRLNIFCFNIFNKKMKGGNMEKVIYGCARVSDRRISHCKPAMHANCFNEIWKNMIHDIGSRQNGVRNRSDVSSLDRLKSSCHDSLRDLCVQTFDITNMMDVSFV